MIFDTSKISFAMADQINNARLISKNSLSSHTFQSLYYWQEQMKLSIICEDDWFTVKCDMKGQNSWFCPCGNVNKTKKFISEKISEKDFRLCYISEADKELLEKEYGESIVCVESPNDSEYIYDIEGQLNLQGGKYANIRTQVHKMERDYQPVVKELNDETVGDAIAVIKEWENGIHSYEQSTLSNSSIDELIFNTMKECGIIGTVVYLDGVPSAVSAGFRIDDKTFDVILSKTSSNIQGLSYFSKREIMKRIYPEYKYLNLEEDLGIIGLQNMKRSMNPIKLNKIWEAEAGK